MLLASSLPKFLASHLDEMVPNQKKKDSNKF